MNDETLDEQVRQLIKTMEMVLTRLEDLESLPTNAAELEEAFGENDDDDGEDWDDFDDDEDLDLDDDEEDDE
jgi:hypothetical protein